MQLILLQFVVTICNILLWHFEVSICCHIFRWFKFTLKPPNSVTHGNLLLAIWDTSHWNFFVKFGLKTAWHISYDILWSLLTYVNFGDSRAIWVLLPKYGALRKSKFSWWRSDQWLTRLRGFRWADNWATWWYHFFGGVTHLRGGGGHRKKKEAFFRTFATV